MEEVVRVPDNYLARKREVCWSSQTYYPIAFFSWDPNKISKKLKLSNDDLTCTVTEGSGFKTVMGN